MSQRPSGHASACSYCTGHSFPTLSLNFERSAVRVVENGQMSLTLRLMLQLNQCLLGQTFRFNHSALCLLYTPDVLVIA